MSAKEPTMSTGSAGGSGSVSASTGSRAMRVTTFTKESGRLAMSGRRGIRRQ